MQATATGWELRSDSDRAERRTVLLRGAARTMSVIAGFAGAVAVLVVGGFMAAVTGCFGSGETTTFCPGSGHLATALEIAALVPGVVAPLAGGIASCVTSRPRWLIGGLAAGALMFGALVWLAMGQQSGLS